MLILDLLSLLVLTSIITADIKTREAATKQSDAEVAQTQAAQEQDNAGEAQTQAELFKSCCLEV
jgi:hypothetical protein